MSKENATPPTAEDVIGRRELRVALAKRDLPQWQLAVRIGVCPSTLSDYLNGRQPAPADLRARIESALGPLPAGGDHVFGPEPRALLLAGLTTLLITFDEDRAAGRKATREELQGVAAVRAWLKWRKSR